jgi:hypothetical protein
LPSDAVAGAPLPVRIGLLRLGVADQFAEIEKMRLRSGALRELNLLHLAIKLSAVMRKQNLS